jgi:hypothetical protein
MGMGNTVLPNGNRAELNVNKGLVNVNNWNGNPNDNVFLGAARQFLLAASTTLSLSIGQTKGEFFVLSPT